MRRIALAVLVLGTMIVGTRAGWAEEKPLFSAERLSAAVGLDYTGFATTGDAPTPRPGNDWEAGIFGAYQLLAKESVDIDTGLKHTRPLLALTGSVAYGLDSNIVRTRVGLRLLVFSGGY